MKTSVKDKKKDVLTETLEALKRKEITEQLEAFMPGNYGVQVNWDNDIEQINRVQINTPSSLNHETLDKITNLRHQWEFSKIDIKRSGVGLKILMEL